jgi:hypothetical protein
MRSSCSSASLLHLAARSAAALLDQLEDAGESLLGDVVLGPDPRPRWTRRRSGRVDLHRRAGDVRGGCARSRRGARRAHNIAGGATPLAPMREIRGGAALVCTRFPPVQLRRRTETVVGPLPGPVEARSVGPALLRLLVVVAATAAQCPSASDLTPAASD